MNKIKIVIADDDSFMRLGLKGFIEQLDHVELVGEAENGKDIINLANNLKPDLIVMDITMEDEDDGLKATKTIKLKNPQIKVLIMSAHGDKEFVKRSIKYKADGYLIKGCSEYEFSTAIMNLMQGIKYYGSKVSEMLLSDFVQTDNPPAAKPKEEFQITKREAEIMQKLLEGLTAKEIAEVLFISRRTVETHKTNLMKKFKVKNTSDLIKIAKSNNLLDK
ncbi:MAG: response regulator transcription factor [Bacteroidia bacterium]|nr:response regulator transcription factor [Bacteroidia bacterium]